MGVPAAAASMQSRIRRLVILDRAGTRRPKQATVNLQAISVPLNRPRRTPRAHRSPTMRAPIRTGFLHVLQQLLRTIDRAREAVVEGVRREALPSEAVPRQAHLRGRCTRRAPVDKGVA